jgi:hypothetical protein
MLENDKFDFDLEISNILKSILWDKEIRNFTDNNPDNEIILFNNLISSSLNWNFYYPKINTETLNLIFKYANKEQLKKFIQEIIFVTEEEDEKIKMVHPQLYSCFFEELTEERIKRLQVLSMDEILINGLQFLKHKIKVNINCHHLIIYLYQEAPKIELWNNVRTGVHPASKNIAPSIYVFDTIKLLKQELEDSHLEKELQSLFNLANIKSVKKEALVESFARFLLISFNSSKSAEKQLATLMRTLIQAQSCYENGIDFVLMEKILVLQPSLEEDYHTSYDWIVSPLLQTFISLHANSQKAITYFPILLSQMTKQIHVEAFIRGLSCLSDTCKAIHLRFLTSKNYGNEYRTRKVSDELLQKSFSACGLEMAKYSSFEDNNSSIQFTFA